MVSSPAASRNPEGQTIRERLKRWSGALAGRLGAQLVWDPVQARDPYPAVRTLRSWSRNDVIFDVGANDGRSIVRMRRQFPQATILAFEPVSSTFRILEQRTHGLHGVRCFQLALGARPARETIYLHEVAAMNSFSADWSAASGREEVDIATLDDVMAEQGIPIVHFLKIDTEGSELDVLAGAHRALAAARIAIIQIEVGIDPRISPHTPFEQVRGLLGEHGYFLFGFFTQARSRRDVRAPAHWSAAEAGRYHPAVIKYCDAVFVAADITSRKLQA